MAGRSRTFERLPRSRLRLGVIFLGLCCFIWYLRAPRTEADEPKVRPPVSPHSQPDVQKQDVQKVEEAQPPPPPPSSKPPVTNTPPNWDKVYEWEWKLPQHNLDLPYPEGKTGRYVKFSNQIKYLGWNNVFNEILMNTHLAYESQRAYVFIDYWWKPEYYQWKALVDVPHTPLNAIISGPTAGGPWDEGDPAPRSIHEKWFEIVCPASERRYINTRDVKPALSNAPGDVVFATWAKLLREAPERCIEVQDASKDEDEYPQTFDLWLWGSSRILPLWESFSKSPTSRLLGSSPVVNSAVDRNEYLFMPRGPRPAHPASRNPYDRMMAIHLRRGDFKEACISLSDWNSTFYSWNLLPSLPDPFTLPPGGEPGNNTPENHAIYMKRCLPTFEEILQKVRDSRSDYIKEGKNKRTLDIMYLLTNEGDEWLEQVKKVLREDGWHTIVTSRDLDLDDQQRDVDMAIDMDIARRAAVFIGNGWSSFTSNIVHRRLIDGKEPTSCRFY